MGRTGTHVIVIGNEKGGSGKSTTGFHLAIYLLYQGFRVASIDVDSGEDGSVECGPDQLGAGQIGAGHDGVGEDGSAQIGPPEPGALERTVREIDPPGFGFGQFGAVQTRRHSTLAHQLELLMGRRQNGAPHVRAVELRVVQSCAGQDRPAQIGVRGPDQGQVREGQVGGEEGGVGGAGLPEIGAPEIGSGEVDLVQDPGRQDLAREVRKAQKGAPAAGLPAYVALMALQAVGEGGRAQQQAVFGGRGAAQGKSLQGEPYRNETKAPLMSVPPQSRAHT